MKKYLFMLLSICFFGVSFGQYTTFNKFKNYLPTYSAEATALFARMASTPDATRKGIINDLIVTLKDQGVWAKIEELWVFAGHTEQASLLNWKSDSFNMVKVNSPTFTIDRGFTGDGVSGYLNPSWVASTDATIYSINSATAGIYVRQTVDENITDFYVSDGTTRIQLKPHYAAQWFYGSINSGTGISFRPTSNMGLGSHEVKRTDAVNTTLTHNGSNIVTGAAAVVGLPTIGITLMKYGGSSYTTKEYSAAWLGSYLTDAESLIFHNALETYLDAIGAGVIP